MTGAGDPDREVDDATYDADVASAAGEALDDTLEKHAVTHTVNQRGLCIGRYPFYQVSDWQPNTDIIEYLFELSPQRLPLFNNGQSLCI